MKLNSKAGKENRKLGDPKKRNKKIILINIGLILSGAIVTGVIYQGLVVPYVRNDERKQTISEMTDDNAQYVQAWKLTKEFKKGDPIDIEKDLKPITVSSENIPNDYITEKSQLKGLVARIKLGEKTVVSSDMFVDMNESIEDSTKNQDYDWIGVHAFAKQGDYVDIHFKKPDGTDYIVAPKKKLIDLSGSVFSMNLKDEDERWLINSATVEASITGGILYTSIYPDPENQEPAKVTYKINNEIKNMIENNPEVLDKAKTQLKNSNKTTVKKKDTQEQQKSQETQTQEEEQPKEPPVIDDGDDSNKPDFAN